MQTSNDLLSQRSPSNTKSVFFKKKTLHNMIVLRGLFCRKFLLNFLKVFVFLSSFLLCLFQVILVHTACIVLVKTTSTYAGWNSTNLSDLNNRRSLFHQLCHYWRNKREREQNKSMCASMCCSQSVLPPLDHSFAHEIPHTDIKVRCGVPGSVAVQRSGKRLVYVVWVKMSIFALPTSCMEFQRGEGHPRERQVDKGLIR